MGGGGAGPTPHSPIRTLCPGLGGLWPDMTVSAKCAGRRMLSLVAWHATASAACVSITRRWDDGMYAVGCAGVPPSVQTAAPLGP